MIERILGLGMLLGWIIRDFMGYGRFDEGIMIFGSLLGFIYLFGNWWTNKPKEKNARTITVSILYGVASWSLTFSLIFQSQYLAGSKEITVMSFILLAIGIGADMLTSINKSRVLNSWTAWRLGILTAFVIAFYVVSEDYRIHITYRNYPEFLKYYEANKGKQPFSELLSNYF